MVWSRMSMVNNILYRILNRITYLNKNYKIMKSPFSKKNKEVELLPEGMVVALLLGEVREELGVVGNTK